MGSKCPRILSKHPNLRRIACGVAFARTHVLPASENNLILLQVKLNITHSVLQLAEEDQTALPQDARAERESFYVDDGLPSVETKEEAIVLHKQLQELFNKGAFKLHKWDSNSQEVRNAIPENIRSTKPTASLHKSDDFTKTLGIEYNSQQDQFRFSVANLAIDEVDITKRSVLSDSAKVFDPLGLLSCVTIVVEEFIGTTDFLQTLKEIGKSGEINYLNCPLYEFHVAMLPTTVKSSNADS